VAITVVVVLKGGRQLQTPIKKKLVDVPASSKRIKSSKE
jgi:hypothetical protein